MASRNKKDKFCLHGQSKSKGVSRTTSKIYEGGFCENNSIIDVWMGFKYFLKLLRIGESFRSR